MSTALGLLTCAPLCRLEFDQCVINAEVVLCISLA